MSEYRNRYGRQWGRGWRPYALVAKVLAVVAFGGGLLAVSVLLHTQPDTPQRLDAVRTLFHWLVIPGSTAAVLFGLLLLAPHAAILLRMRWLRVKLLFVVIGLPAAHATAYLAFRDGNPARLALVADATLLLLVALVALGRQKPRLGQRYTPRN